MYGASECPARSRHRGRAEKKLKKHPGIRERSYTGVVDHTYAHVNSIIVTSGGTRKRRGRTVVPIPREM